MEVNFQEEYYNENINWICVGLTYDVPNRNDFILYKGYGHNIFIQNNGKELEAYSNICLHRSASIFQQQSGNGRAICPYHGWFYRKGKCSQTKKELAKYKVVLAGDFIFLEINKTEQTLNNYLGEFYFILQKISSKFQAAEFMKKSLKIKSSVNLVLENVLECLHCLHIHKSTLGPIGMGQGIPKDHITHGRHDKISYPLTISANRRVPKEVSILREESFQYDHLYIYPNLLVSVTNNEFVYIGILSSNPMNTETSISARGLILKGLDQNDRKINAFYSMSWNNTLEVLAEDQIIVEDQYNNFIHFNAQNNNFTIGEDRINNQLTKQK